jgi:hypothetical protein
MIATLHSLPFRIVVVGAGIALIGFFGILFPAALINLPDSWIGVLYAGYGLTAGGAAVAYFFRRSNVLLWLMLPALIFMAVTLSGVIH